MEPTSFLRLYSIGHSNQPIGQFLDLLDLHGIQAIADVRSSPYSRHNPQFSKEQLEQTLRGHGISYAFLGNELGARRAEPECYRNGRVDYNQVAQTSAFQQGIERIVHVASKMKVAMMCAEQDPLACHRAILIGRNILSRVDDVAHILPDGTLETQAQAEQRLLVECRLQNEDMFATREERIEEAYQRRSSSIAYEEPAPHA